jgi:hypothetical protein
MFIFFQFASRAVRQQTVADDLVENGRTQPFAMISAVGEMMGEPPNQARGWYERYSWALERTIGILKL